MRLCSYIVSHDTGFAPNPFWGYCTLAACTPNHMGIAAKPGDWFAGFQEKKRGNKLVFAMEVSEVLHYDAYYRDRRFQRKKPRISGTWRQRCGDNIYFRDASRYWKQDPEAAYHRSPDHVLQDTKHARTYVSEVFYYFGANAPGIPEEFSGLIKKSQGCKCNHSQELVGGFLDWLRSHYKLGLNGEPRDRKDGGCSSDDSTNGECKTSC